MKSPHLGEKKKVDEELRPDFGYMRPFLKPANIGSICYQLVRCWFTCICCSFPARFVVKESNTPREIQFEMIMSRYQCSVKIILSTKNKYSKFTF